MTRGPNVTSLPSEMFHDEWNKRAVVNDGDAQYLRDLVLNETNPVTTHCILSFVVCVFFFFIKRKQTGSVLGFLRVSFPCHFWFGPTMSTPAMPCAHASLCGHIC